MQLYRLRRCVCEIGVATWISWGHRASYISCSQVCQVGMLGDRHRHRRRCRRSLICVSEHALETMCQCLRRTELKRWKFRNTYKNSEVHFERAAVYLSSCVDICYFLCLPANFFVLFWRQRLYTMHASSTLVMRSRRYFANVFTCIR